MATPSAAQTKLTLGNLGNTVLHSGDNDAQNRWGGLLQNGISGTPIAELQAALSSVGTFSGSADGDFSDATTLALRRFQWCASNMQFRLHVPNGSQIQAGTVVAFTNQPVGNPGFCSAVTAAELLSWQSNGFMTTTPLVRLSMVGLSNVETSDSFTVLSYPGANKQEVLVHTDFVDVIRVALNGQAKLNQVTLLINQTFRRNDVAPTGAVVTPAKKSQHLIGHAVDLNIQDGSAVNTASMFAAGRQTQSARNFIHGVEAMQGIRWGGRFSEPDYIHFDKILDPTSLAYDMTAFFAQNSFLKGHPMRVVA